LPLYPYQLATKCIPLADLGFKPLAPSTNA
jgi:hypothetical protein